MKLTSALFALAFSAIASGLAAQDIRLSVPLACRLGTDCYIQQYVDQDPGGGARDYACGPLSYNKHSGTDFAVPTLRDMARGVNVIAAAPGTVINRRDGMSDQTFVRGETIGVNRRECGNGVVIDHGGGWTTQYCHLARQSVRVRAGDRVRRGQVLGKVGLSGRTQFPHVHLTVRKNDAIVDPFQPSTRNQCGRGGRTLWDRKIAYRSGGLLDAGFATRVPDYRRVKAGDAQSRNIRQDAPALVLFGFAYGGRRGDTMRLTISGPQGRIYEDRPVLGKNQVQFFRAGGLKRPKAGWPTGQYVGRIQMIRNGKVISERRVQTNVGR